ncbi:MAG: S8 family serine peptidase [Candidatus Odinarchaeota archaeon]
MKIYQPFNDKLENIAEDQEFRVLISFENPSNREEFIKKYENLKILGKIDIIPSILVDLKKAQVINYEKEELIINIEEDQYLFPSMLDINEILGLDEYKNSEILYTGKNVKVGIVDNGINREFSSIADRSIKKYAINVKDVISKENERKNEVTHATIIASIISNRFQDINNNYIGIAPNVSILDFDISNDSQKYSFYQILKVLDRIEKEKINLDILFIPFTTKTSSDGKDLLSLACDLLVEKEIIVICPTGNFGPDNYTIGSPSSAKKAITIGALTKELEIVNFSGRGPTLDERTKPDLCFPGYHIKIPLNKELMLNATGTSVSAAIGVGIIALIKEYDPTITYDSLKELLTESSIDLNYDKNTQGLGTINVLHLFSKLDLFHEKLVPYKYLIKKSIFTVIEIIIFLIVLFYIFYFFRI